MNAKLGTLARACKWASMSAAIGLGTACGDAQEPQQQPDARPSAQAGADQVVSTRQFVQLNAAGSRNTAGETSAISYQWRQLAGPEVAFEEGAGADTALPQFLAPWAAEDETLVFELTVEENGVTDIDQVMVTVDGCSTESGDIFTDCLAEGFGPMLAYEADEFGAGGVHINGQGDHHVQWNLVKTDDPQHNTVIEARWNANDPFDEQEVNGWFGLLSARSAGADLSQYADGALQFEMRVMNQGDRPGYLITKMECFYPCTSDDAWVKESAELQQWQTYTYSLAHLRESGLDLTAVSTPFIIHPAWGSQSGSYVLQIDNIRLLEQYQPQIDVPALPSEQQELTIYADGFVDNDSDDDSDYVFGLHHENSDEHLQVQEIELSDGQTVLQLDYTQPASRSAFFVYPFSERPDFSMFHHGEVVFDMRVVSYGGNDGVFEFNTYCGWPCKALPWYNLGRPAEGQWQTQSVPVAELVARGVELNRMWNAFFLGFSGTEQEGLTVQLNNIRWQYLP